MLAGMLLGAVTYYPMYQFMYQFRFDGGNYQPVTLAFFVFIQLIYVTMVYGPIAAMLVEMFPTRIRYTSMSLPYHIGNGWFGGLLPATALAIVARIRAGAATVTAAVGTSGCAWETWAALVGAEVLS
jgi:hypothetical protein